MRAYLISILICHAAVSIFGATGPIGRQQQCRARLIRSGVIGLAAAAARAVVNRVVSARQTRVAKHCTRVAHATDFVCIINNKYIRMCGGSGHMLYFIMDATGPDGANHSSIVRTIKYQPAVCVWVDLMSCSTGRRQFGIRVPKHLLGKTAVQMTVAAGSVCARVADHLTHSCTKYSNKHSYTIALTHKQTLAHTHTLPEARRK